MECGKCGTAMMTAQFSTGAHGVPPYLTRKRKGAFEPEYRCGVDCFVCPAEQWSFMHRRYRSSC